MPEVVSAWPVNESVRKMTAGGTELPPERDPLRELVPAVGATIWRESTLAKKRKGRYLAARSSSVDLVGATHF